MFQGNLELTLISGLMQIEGEEMHSFPNATLAMYSTSVDGYAIWHENRQLLGIKLPYDVLALRNLANRYRYSSMFFVIC